MIKQQLFASYFIQVFNHQKSFVACLGIIFSVTNESLIVRLV